MPVEIRRLGVGRTVPGEPIAAAFGSPGTVRRTNGSIQFFTSLEPPGIKKLRISSPSFILDECQIVQRDAELRKRVIPKIRRVAETMNDTAYAIHLFPMRKIALGTSNRQERDLVKMIPAFTRLRSSSFAVARQAGRQGHFG